MWQFSWLKRSIKVWYLLMTLVYLFFLCCGLTDNEKVLEPAARTSTIVPQPQRAINQRVAGHFGWLTGPAGVRNGDAQLVFGVQLRLVHPLWAILDRLLSDAVQGGETARSAATTIKISTQLPKKEIRPVHNNINRIGEKTTYEIRTFTIYAIHGFPLRKDRFLPKHLFVGNRRNDN